MPSTLEILREIKFGKRVAEDEGEWLSGYFVETNNWRDLLADEVDIVYGAKGAGKSALYALLNNKTDELFDRGVLLVPAENPRGAIAFKDLETDPPAGEREFIGVWKLYFVCLLSATFDDYGIVNADSRDLRGALECEGLVKGKRTLAGMLKVVRDYVKTIIRRPSVSVSMELDPITGMPAGYSGKISFEEPDAVAAKQGARSVDELLEVANRALRSAKYAAWLLLDRLDVAFTENENLEQNALRALFRVYQDMKGFGSIRVKIFLRTDIWQKITHGGLREGSHVTRERTIKWETTSLLNLVVRRLIQNPILLAQYRTTRESVLASIDSQKEFFYKVFPEQVDPGSRRPATFEWMLSRTKDGTGVTAPRELIHLLNALRDKQIHAFEIGDSEPEGERLFSRLVFRSALAEVSKTRLEQTLYAEYPWLIPWLEALRDGKAQHSTNSLAAAWQVDEDVARERAAKLVEVGVFEQRGERTDPQFWVPMLYRDSLSLVQGAADKDD